MDLETAEISLVGNRADNQDRAQILIGDEGVLAVVADGMGGHACGALAAETAIAALDASFRHTWRRRPDPIRFLAETIAAAHREVLALGGDMAPESKPGTTVVCALVLDGDLWWAHVGDSRAYHLREGKSLARTRDHTVIEALIESGEITPGEAENHPGRHVVEHCLGVAPDPPPIEVGESRRLLPGDVVLLCSDGFWSQLEETYMIKELTHGDNLHRTLLRLAGEAANNEAPHSDNVTALALRALGDGEAPA